MEEYEEVETEDFTVNDFIFMGGMILAGCVVIAFISYIVKKTFKNIHLKIGDKIEVGVETKEEK